MAHRFTRHWVKVVFKPLIFFFSPVITIESELPQFILISVWIERLSMGVLIYQRSWFLQKLLPLSALLLTLHRRAKHLCWGRHILFCAKTEECSHQFLCLQLLSQPVIVRNYQSLISSAKHVHVLTTLFSFPLPKRHITC